MIRNQARPDPWALTRDVRALVGRHPAPFWGDVITTTDEWPMCSVSFVVPELTRLILSTDGVTWSATVLGGTTAEDALRLLAQCDQVPRGPIDLLAARVADCLQLRGGAGDTLPPWLADPVRYELRRRAGELLTLAGSSPADVVSAAETVDEALCRRPPVEPTFSGVTNALMAIGMSCRWIGGDPLILIGDFVYLRDDLSGAPIDVFAAFTEKHGKRRMVKGDKSGAPAVPGYRVFMALARETP